jgi:polyphenol oxidase
MFSIFKNHPEIICKISEKKDGDMKFLFGEKKVLENRKKYFYKIKIDEEKVFFAEVVHGKKAVKIGKRKKRKNILGADALMTSEKEKYLALTVADCLPIYIFDPKAKAIGLIHAGWRGLSKDIIFEAISKFKFFFGTKSKDILVGIGPGISLKNFEVGKDVSCFFEKYGKGVLLEKNGKEFLDLKKIAELKLLEMGILKKNIEISSECTFKNKEKYFSYRRDRPEKIQAMLAILGIREKKL